MSDRTIKKHKKKIDALEKVELSLAIIDLVMIKESMDLAGFYLKQQIDYGDTQIIRTSITKSQYKINRKLTKQLEEEINNYLEKRKQHE